MKRVLFVCTGNTCRSPMAEAILKEMSDKEEASLEIKSAGISAFEGIDVSHNSKRVLEEMGINHTNVSQSITKDMLDWADIILTMTLGHKNFLLSLYPKGENKVFTLKEYSFSGDNQENHSSVDIKDPFGGSFEFYKEVATEIEDCIKQISEQWKKGE